MVKRNSKAETTENLPLVAIDLGSNSMKLIVAEEQDCPGSDSPLLSIQAALDTPKKRGYMKKGIILNPSEASYVINESMRLVSNKLQMREVLPAAVTLLGGKTMRCVSVKSKRSQGRRLPISRALLDNMQEECFNKINHAKSKQPVTALDAHPAFFMLDDKQHIGEPEIGTEAVQIEGTYNAFFGTPELYEKVDGTFQRAGKSIERTFARPVALIEALASEEDEFSGIAIIDMGAETTTVSVYKGGQFLSCMVATQGGANITLDIAQQGISMENAELLKQRFGTAIEQTTGTKTIRIPAAHEGDAPVLVNTGFLSHIIVSRLDEIMLPIMEEIGRYEDQISGIYLTGGASLLNDMEAYVQSHTSLPVSYGSHADWLALDTEEEYYKPQYSATIGALLLTAKYRRMQPGKPLPSTTIKRVTGRIVDLFSEQN